MPATIALRERHSIKKLKSVIKKCADHAKKNRLRAIVNIKKGKTRVEVADMLSCSRDSVTDWVIAYNEEGLAEWVPSHSSPVSAVLNVATFKTCLRLSNPNVK